MTYSRAERLVQLALEMQASRTGLTIRDIMERFNVSRRTAFRMRDAVIRTYPQADEVQSDDRLKRWRLRGDMGQTLVGISADDLASLEAGIKVLETLNLNAQAAEMRRLGLKVRALLPDRLMRQFDPDLEALIEAEAFAHRPGPRPVIRTETLRSLRDAIKSCRKISFKYAGRDKNDEPETRVACPLGFLFGYRHYLVATGGADTRIKFYSLSAIEEIHLLEDSFTRDPNFNIRDMSAKSFGVFEEDPVDVMWRFSARAAPVARQFLFHESQVMEDGEDGSLLVSFRAGGQLEMAWHLLCWGQDVEVLSPLSLKQLMPAEKPKWPALP
jgi:predicted DNA-binding transcriptional regulator YafY